MLPSGTTLRLAASLGALLALAGCNSILGFDDYAVGQGGSGGQTGKEGQGGSGGAADECVTGQQIACSCANGPGVQRCSNGRYGLCECPSGKGGSGGSGGSGGKSGSGGKGGSGGKSGSGGSTGIGGASASCGTKLYNNDACDACIRSPSGCCSQSAACAGNSQCLNYISCFYDCTPGQTACYQACQQDYPLGQELFDALNQCKGSICQETCGGPSSQCGLSYADPSCQSCSESACCAEDAACANDPVCLKLLDCYSGCSDNKCYSACDAQYPSGRKAELAMDGCLGQKCAGACGYTSYAVCNSGFFNSSQSCAQCLTASCCKPYSACVQNLACADCLRGLGPAGCENSPLFQLQQSCKDSACSSACGSSAGGG